MGDGGRAASRHVCRQTGVRVRLHSRSCPCCCTHGCHVVCQCSTTPVSWSAPLCGEFWLFHLRGLHRCVEVFKVGEMLSSFVKSVDELTMWFESLDFWWIQQPSWLTVSVKVFLSALVFVDSVFGSVLCRFCCDHSEIGINMMMWITCLQPVCDEFCDSPLCCVLVYQVSNCVWCVLHVVWFNCQRPPFGSKFCCAEGGLEVPDNEAGKISLQ